MTTDRETPGSDYDSPWKEALDRFFERCLAFFFPHAHADIDWARGHEMLDKELQPIVRKAEGGRLYVDKLVKVWLKSGEEKWLLIHIEVQGSREGAFPARMHVYNHRIFDRYHREVVSFAILADDDPGWRPNRYESARWGFRSLTEFPIVKLLDYAQKYEELEADPNPFAVVVLAQLKAMETRRSPDERRAWKVRLVKGLYGRGMDIGGCTPAVRLHRLGHGVTGAPGSTLPRGIRCIPAGEAYALHEYFPKGRHAGGVAPGHRSLPEAEVRRRGPGADAGDPRDL